MKLQEVLSTALQLPIDKRWQLVQFLLESLKQETHSVRKKGNLSRLRGIAKSTLVLNNEDTETDYVNYLTKKSQ